MQFFATIALFVSVALAIPAHDVADLTSRDNSICPGGLLFSNPQCCDTDVAGVASLDCKNPEETPDSTNTFKDICSKVGRQPKCCSIPLAGLALLCTDAIGQ